MSAPTAPPALSELTADALRELANVDAARWGILPPFEVVAATAEAVRRRGIAVIEVPDAAAACAAIATAIPPGSEVMNGSSTTLLELGFPEMVKDPKYGWRHYNARVLAENDESKRADLRRKGVTADVFVASVNAIAETGELVAGDRSGSRVGAMPFAAKKLVLVAGANKIVPSVAEAMQRLEHYAYPLEHQRAQKVYGMASGIGKVLIFAHEWIKDRTTLILVNERLGY